MSKAKAVISSEIEGMKDAGTWKDERIITSKMGPSINVTGKNEQILNFCANNYLGLSVSDSHTFEPRHVISNNVAFWQIRLRWACAASFYA